MITEFENWFQTVHQEIEDCGYGIEIRKVTSEFEGECIIVDFDSKDTMARITWWNVNECSQQILDVESEITLLDQYLIIESSPRFDDFFAEFLKILKQT